MFVAKGEAAGACGQKAKALRNQHDERSNNMAAIAEAAKRRHAAESVAGKYMWDGSRHLADDMCLRAGAAAEENRLTSICSKCVW